MLAINGKEENNISDYKIQTSKP